MAGSDSEPPDLEDGDFDMFDLFDLDLGDGKKTTINDPDAKKYLAQQRRAAQAEYEDTLIREVNKLQQLAKQDVVARRQAEAEILALKAREVKRRKDDQDRQRKQLAKLATAEALEKQQAADWAKKSREVEARTVEIERKKVEEQERSTEERIRAVRVLREKQEAITAKALHDRERQAAIKRQLDEQKRAALVSRLKTRSQQRLEANQRKATFAAERVHKAWESRNVALVEAREASELKHLRQEVRLYKLVEGKEAKQSSTKAKAGQKRLYIEKCVSQQLDRDEGVKARIDAKHSEREAAQDSAEAQRLKQIEVRQYERLAQQHEVRERVLSAIKSRQAHLGEVESKWAVKNGRTSALLKEREDASASRRQLYSLLTKERQSVINSMQLSKVNKKFILPPHVRKGISDATLKAVLDKADPKRTGAISLNTLNDVLGEMDPALFAHADGDGASEGPLTDAERKRSQLLFMRLDANADGEIDFGEFQQIVVKITRQRGTAAKSEEWMRRAFEAVDADANGQIDFDEFVAAQARLEPSAAPVAADG